LIDAPRIVGIGASAGGIEALRVFFQNVPMANGLGFVVILHLSPDRASMLAEVLGRWTGMPVDQAEDGMAVERDHVYVIPPNLLMTIKGGRLRLQVPSTPMRENHPVDIFFGSLAADKGGNAIGVVLSGTGSDGALGLKAIKEAGGMSLAQGSGGGQPQYAGMPSAAVAAGAVDLIVPVEAMPQRILRLEARPESEGEEAATPEADKIAALKPAICDILRNQVGHDFNGYKQQTFVRRVHRRMQFLGLDLPEYVQRLREDKSEVGLLFHDLLIGVTSFFRDPEAYAAIEEIVIPQLFNGKGAANTIRIWVTGCATGEEAYSLAILMSERMAQQQAPPKVQIFATDIDEAAISVARLGRYPAALLKDVAPARLERFFIAADASYLVRREVRELCTFSVHSVIRDPPFSMMDLISCRNLLIYMDPELQERVIPTFHYSLVPDGYLLLGGSETVTRHGELFAPVDKKNRIFRRRAAPTPALQVSAIHSASSPVRPPRRYQRHAATSWTETALAAGDRVLERFAPPFVVTNDEGEVLHFSSRTGRYLEPAPGMPSRDVVSMARRGLRLELRAALRQALETGQTIQRERVNVEMNGGSQQITLTIEPLTSNSSDRLFLVVFSDIGLDEVPGATREQPGRLGSATSGVTEASTIEQLERELRDAREQQQSTAEEYETALEELKSVNEELQSFNEEMQSTNEELETSKEEIQSMNEELQTVNSQLTSKVDELDHTNSDLRNLFESTQVATIFLDRFMIIRGFTPAVAGVYNLIPSDKGRPLTDIASQIDYVDLRADVSQVLETLQPFERRVARQDDNTHYLLRILPYRTADDQVDGVLVTFLDVTSMVQAERHQHMLVDELNHRVRNMLTVVISLARQTLRQSRTLEQFSTSFLGRVDALAAAYTLLSRDHWTDVKLRSVLLEELQPFTVEGRDKFEIEGPPLYLKPRGALTISMVVHELVTNAVKYGALSVPAGKVMLRWSIEPQGEGSQLVWRWIERGGPPVSEPARRGFGTSMIERSLKYELKGAAEFAFKPEGLEVLLTVPLDPAVASSTPSREPN